MDENATAAPGTRIWFRDFGYYALRWTIIIGVLTALNPVFDVEESAFWHAKLYQLLLGIGYGFVCAVVFTLAQNGLNTRRSKPVSWGIAIAVVVGMNLLLALGTGRFSDGATRALSRNDEGTSAARTMALEKGAAKAAKQIDGLQAQVVKEKPELPPAYALQEAAVKKTGDDLSKETDPAKKADTAAGQFVGFYFINVRTRADYCKTLGVDISQFVTAFKRDHAQLYAKSRAIHNRTNYGADTIENETYKALLPTFQKVMADAMVTMARQNNVTEREVCEVLAQNGEETAKEMRLSAINPVLYRTLSEAK